jgi:hypothetical protein
MDSTARLPHQSLVLFPCHRDLRLNSDFLGETSMRAGAVIEFGARLKSRPAYLGAATQRMVRPSRSLA